MPIYRDTYYSKSFQFKTRADGQPIDISTWEFSSSLRDAEGTELLAMTTALGHFTVTDGPNGWMRFALTEAETEALTAGQVGGALYRTDGANGDVRLGRFTELVRDRD